MAIPFGYCHCGCGQPTPIAHYTAKAAGITKGESTRYVHGHNGRLPEWTLERLRASCAVDPVSGCWNWLKSTRNSGYAQLNVGKSNVSVHRLAYELATGEGPGSNFVCHTCDNRKCINPHHLFLGTCADNVADMISKSRHAHGERVPQHKLTETVVREIKQLLLSGKFLQREIAERYRVSLGAISHIKRGSTWKHVGGVV